MAHVLLRQPRRMPLDLEAQVALLEQHRRAVAAQERVAQPRLEPVPAGRERAGEIAAVLVVHAQYRTEPVRLHPLARALQTIFAHAVPVDPLLPIQAGDAEIRSHERLPVMPRTDLRRRLGKTLAACRLRGQSTPAIVMPRESGASSNHRADVLHIVRSDEAP